MNQPLTPDQKLEIAAELEKQEEKAYREVQTKEEREKELLKAYR